MKTTLTLIVLAALAGAGISAAEDGTEKEKPAKKAKAAGLMTADKDSDGKITQEEFTAWAAARPKPLPAEKAEALFKKRDTNGDGAITKDELRAGAPGKKAGDDKGDAKKTPKKKKKQDDQ